MSKEKREKERAAWRELKIVIHNYRALGKRLDWVAKYFFLQMKHFSLKVLTI